MKSVAFPARPPLIPESGHLPVIDEIKGLAILLVVWYHISALFGVPNQLHGEIGVDIFLIVSGIILVWRSAEMPVSAFIRRRFLRIFPSYWFALGLFLYLSWKCFGVVRTPTNLLLHVFGVHGFAPERYFFDVNDSFWFISALVGAYAGFLLLRKRVDDFSFLAGVGALVTTVACIVYDKTGHGAGFGHLAIRIPSYFIGLMTGQIVCGRPFTVKLNHWLAGALLCVYYLTLQRAIVFGYPLPAFFFIVGWAYVSPWIRDSSFVGWLPGVFAWAGTFSYEIYLLHQPLMRDYTRLFLERSLEISHPSQKQFLAAVLVAGLVVCCAAWVLHHLTNLLFRPARLNPGRPVFA